RWVQIAKFMSKPDVQQPAPGVWNIGGKLEARVFADAPGEVVSDGINGSVRRGFTAKRGDVFQRSVCVYQPTISNREPAKVQHEDKSLAIGEWRIQRSSSGDLALTNTKSAN